MMLSGIAGSLFVATDSGMVITAVEAFMDTVAFAWRVGIVSATSGVPLKTDFVEGFGRSASLGACPKKRRTDE